MRRALAGLVDALPFLPGVLVLGIVWGASAGSAGIEPLAAVVMSAIVWSGAGQFAALPLWREGIGIVAVTVLMLSLRFTLMATSLAPRLAGASVPRPMRALIAFTITDENYALSVTRGRGHVDPPYVIGAWVSLYAPWLLGTVIGVVAGAQVAGEQRELLTAIFPMVFLTLTVLVCTSTTLTLVAILGGALSVVGALILPPGWNVLLAGLAASAVGPWLDDRLRRR